MNNDMLIMVVVNVVTVYISPYILAALDIRACLKDHQETCAIAIPMLTWPHSFHITKTYPFNVYNFSHTK